MGKQDLNLEPSSDVNNPDAEMHTPQLNGSGDEGADGTHSPNKTNKFIIPLVIVSSVGVISLIVYSCRRN